MYKRDDEVEAQGSQGSRGAQGSTSALSKIWALGVISGGGLRGTKFVQNWDKNQIII